MRIKEYTLYINLWRCGGEGSHRLGSGYTRMLNDEGYMCCLGQFALQAGASPAMIMDTIDPIDVATRKGVAYDHNMVVVGENGEFENSLLAQYLVELNDSEWLQVHEKIKCIRKVLLAHGINLKVVYDSNHGT